MSKPISARSLKIPCQQTKEKKIFWMECFQRSYWLLLEKCCFLNTSKLELSHARLVLLVPAKNDIQKGGKSAEWTKLGNNPPIFTHETWTVIFKTVSLKNYTINELLLGSWLRNSGQISSVKTLIMDTSTWDEIMLFLIDVNFSWRLFTQQRFIHSFTSLIFLIRVEVERDPSCQK